MGGAEYRLPVLMGILRRTAHQSVPVNLAVSLVTLLAALPIRLTVLADFPLLNLLPVLVSITLGATLSAFIAAGFAVRISPRQLENWIQYLLIGIGVLLILEGLLPLGDLDLLHAPVAMQVIVALAFGVLIGIVSSTLGVAGGELIIPTLILVYGVDIKIAGTASLIISLPVVFAGLARYHRAGELFDRAAFTGLVVPMGLGSVTGSILGGLLLGLVSPYLLKIILGGALILSAARMFSHRQKTEKVLKTT
ncbi:MAG TPA: sulfite exporter TauE/SafE family protein [Levilinea sp.]|nr:sulfite exporter TauE/SafE family protein [Levilinea sp.]